jgi:hypothetical protein
MTTHSEIAPPAPDLTARGTVSIRRLFWLGAAVLFSIAALLAIIAVLGGTFGVTEGRILLTCGLAFICGSVALAGVACLDRDIVRPAAWAAIALGLTAFAMLTFGIWAHPSSHVYAKTAGVVSVWMVAALIVTTSRMASSSPRVLRTVVPGAWLAATSAALLGSVMILGQTGRPWKIELVLVILTALGYALVPALERFWSAGDSAPAERLLGTLGNVDVFAVRGGKQSVTIGSTSTALAAREGIVLREHV